MSANVSTVTQCITLKSEYSEYAPYIIKNNKSNGIYLTAYKAWEGTLAHGFWSAADGIILRSGFASGANYIIQGSYAI